MGQIVAISPGIGVADLRPAYMPPSQAQAAFNRSVASAATAVNSGGLLGENRELTFAVDPSTHRPVIRVMDVNTNEVVDQWPPEYLLELAAEAKSSARDSG